MKKPIDPKLYAKLQKAEDDLEAGRISRRSFNKILALATAAAGATFAEMSPVHAWVATRMRKRKVVSSSYSPTASLRFDASRSTYFTRTPGTAGNQQKWTWSVWVKRGMGNSGNGEYMLSSGSNYSNNSNTLITDILFHSSTDVLGFYSYNSGAVADIRTNAVFRDPTAWYHIVIGVDTTQVVPSERVQISVNGIRQTSFLAASYPAQNTSMWINGTNPHAIGHYLGNGGGLVFDGVMSDAYLIDGQQLAATSFGQTDATTAQWVPKAYAGTFGTNGFYLPFKSNSAASGTGTASGSYPSVSGVTGLGADFSGANNHWTSSNFATTDQVVDLPTNNYCVLNCLTPDGGTYKAGNSKFVGPSAWRLAKGTIQIPSTGKWAYGAKIYGTPYTPRIPSGEYCAIGFILSSSQSNPATFWYGTDRVVFGDNGYSANCSSTLIDAGVAISSGDVIECLIDRDANTYAFKRAGTTLASGTIGLAAGVELHPLCLVYDTSYGMMQFDFGQNGYTPSDGSYKTLCTANLATPSILKPSQYFTSKTYTGTGSPLRIGDIVPMAASYQVARSLRFSASDSSSLTRTPAGNGSAKTWTWSTWVKRHSTTTSANHMLFSEEVGGGSITGLAFYNDTLYFAFANSSTYLITNAVYQNVSEWMHIVAVADTTQATASDRLKIYVNGVQVTSFATANYPAQNATAMSQFNSNTAVQYIGRNSSVSPSYMDGYMAEIYFIDGFAMTASDFGQIDSSSGEWRPKAYSGSYGANGYFLNFADNSNTTAATLGKDLSSNNNHWTPSNFSITAGAANDSLTDTPADFGSDSGGTTTNSSGNYCTMNPATRYASLVSVSNGNLVTSHSTDGSTQGSIAGTLPVTGGKYYFEVLLGGTSPTVSFGSVGFYTKSLPTSYYGNLTNAANSCGWTAIYTGTLNLRFPDGTTITPASLTYGSGDLISVALDADSGNVWYAKNGTWILSGNPATGANPSIYGLKPPMWPGCGTSDNGNSGTTFTWNFGQRPFTYAPPTGFKTWNTRNFPAVTSTAQTQPDLVWIKSRSNGTDHALYDSVRGVGLDLSSNNISSTESTPAGGLSQFTKTGFVVGSLAKINTLNATYAAWMWKKGSSPGFDIVTYTGDGGGGQTIAHSLGSAPALIIGKPRTVAGSWCVYHKDMATSGISGGCLFLDDTNGFSSGRSTWNNTLPGSSSFTAGGLDLNRSATPFVAYLWKEIAGFSKFGTYTGNGSTNGPVNWCGFRPSFVMIKRIDSSGNWQMFDCLRDPMNVGGWRLLANSSTTEADARPRIDFLSSGFKNRDSDPDVNASGGKYVFIAFAEAPFKSANAR